LNLKPRILCIGGVFEVFFFLRKKVDQKTVVRHCLRNMYGLGKNGVNLIHHTFGGKAGYALGLFFQRIHVGTVADHRGDGKTDDNNQADKEICSEGVVLVHGLS